MDQSTQVSRVVPYGADQIVYLVVDRLRTGKVYRETEIERVNLDTVISDLLTGQFSDPVRIVAFNTLEHWSDDVSIDVAEEILCRSDIEWVEIPEHLRNFLADHTPAVRQLNLRLA